MSKKNGKSKNGHSEVDLRTLPKDKRPKPTSGQSAPERELPWESLNDDEREVIKMLNGGGPKAGGDRKVRSVEWLADGVDSKLVARNALRRPVSCGWIDRISRGQYQISEKGRRRMQRLAN